MIPGMNARILVVDDEALARDRLKRLLAACTLNATILQARTGDEAIERVRSDHPDLVFLDVRLPDMDGFDVIARVTPAEMPPVVFVTAYDSYAIRAFDVHAVDYLVKPYTEERLRTAYTRACGRSMDQSRVLDKLLDALAQRERYLQRVMVRTNDGHHVIRTTDIEWIEAESNYVRIHANGKSHLLRERLSSMEERLDPARFARIHRSMIVNLDAIMRMQPWFSGDYLVTLASGKDVRMSRTYREAVQRQLGIQPEPAGS